MLTERVRIQKRPSARFCRYFPSILIHPLQAGMICRRGATQYRDLSFSVYKMDALDQIFKIFAWKWLGRSSVTYGGGGGNLLRPYSQQRPVRTNPSCCLGLVDHGQHKSTNRHKLSLPLLQERDDIRKRTRQERLHEMRTGTTASWVAIDRRWGAESQPISAAQA